jgi:hypothetical protein
MHVEGVEDGWLWSLDVPVGKKLNEAAGKNAPIRKYECMSALRWFASLLAMLVANNSETLLEDQDVLYEQHSELAGV